MKIKLTIIGENDVPISNLGDNPKDKIRNAYMALFNMLNSTTPKNEKMILEDIEIIE